MISTLKKWLDENKEKLTKRNVEIEDRIPLPMENFRSKATIGMTLDNVACNFTVWDRTPFETSLIVFDTSSKSTLLFRDEPKASLDEVIETLEGIASQLTSRAYHRMSPDPKLIIR